MNKVKEICETCGFTKIMHTKEGLESIGFEENSKEIMGVCKKFKPKEKAITILSAKPVDKEMIEKMIDNKETLADKMENHCKRCGIKVVKERFVKEFIKKIKEELNGDTLAYGYKAYQREGIGMSTMEICHRENCNSFVIKKIKKIIDKLAGEDLLK